MVGFWRKFVSGSAKGIDRKLETGSFVVLYLKPIGYPVQGKKN
jgi:hypothetical protein